MTSSDVDTMLDRLQSYLPDEPNWFAKNYRSDWKQFWEQVKVVQAAFKAGVRYPTKEERQAAWDRFSGLCAEAKRRAEHEHMVLDEQSKDQRDTIMGMCSGIYFSKIVDDIFFFDRVTVDQMKLWGRYLRDAMTALKDRKHLMTGRHKQEVFERIQAVKESHEHFWNLYRQAQAAKQQQWESHQRDRTSKRAEFKRRVEANIDKNQEKLERAVHALEKVKAHASETRDKIAESDSDKWISIWSGWLVEDERRIDDIEESIKRIMGWIEEDKRKLREIDD